MCIKWEETLQVQMAPTSSAKAKCHWPYERAQQDAIKVVLPNSDSCLGWTRVQLCSGWLPILLVHEMNQILRRSQGVLGLEERRLLTCLQILADHGLDGKPPPPLLLPVENMVRTMNRVPAGKDQARGSGEQTIPRTEPLSPTRFVQGPGQGRKGSP